MRIPFLHRRSHRLAGPRYTGVKFCEVLGLDPNLIEEMSIEFPVGDLPIVHIRRFLTEEETGKLTGFIRAERYKLVAAGKGVPERIRPNEDGLRETTSSASMAREYIH